MYMYVCMYVYHFFLDVVEFCDFFDKCFVIFFEKCSLELVKGSMRVYVEMHEYVVYACVCMSAWQEYLYITQMQEALLLAAHTCTHIRIYTHVRKHVYI